MRAVGGVGWGTRRASGREWVQAIVLGGKGLQLGEDRCLVVTGRRRQHSNSSWGSPASSARPLKYHCHTGGDYLSTPPSHVSLCTRQTCETRDRHRMRILSYFMTCIFYRNTTHTLSVQNPLCEPLGVCPPDPIDHLLLPLESASNVDELVDFHKEVVEDASRQYAAGSLSEQVHFAE
jgi:hypothetical protein